MSNGVLVVGSVAFDSVRTPAGAAQDVLGGAATYASVAAGFFAEPVRIVGVVGDDFPEEHVEFLRSRRVDLSGLERRAGRTFRWTGSYGENLNEATTLDTQLNVFADFDPTLAEAHRDSAFVLLANIDPALQRRVLDQVRSPTLVVADTMNYWIQNRREDLLATLARVGLAVVNDAEARLLTGLRNLTAAARAIRAMGPAWVVIKKGEHGAMLFGEDFVVSAPAYPLDVVRDPTGAGDSFAGAFLGSLAAEGEVGPSALRRALAAGTVVASFNIEEFSLSRLRTLTREEIARRRAQLLSLTDLSGNGRG